MWVSGRWEAAGRTERQRAAAAEMVDSSQRSICTVFSGGCPLLSGLDVRWRSWRERGTVWERWDAITVAPLARHCFVNSRPMPRVAPTTKTVHEESIGFIVRCVSTGEVPGGTAIGGGNCTGMDKLLFAPVPPLDILEATLMRP